VSGFGAYVHIPFCTKRCDYCAFATTIDQAGRIPAYLSAVCSHIEADVRQAHLPALTSVFFGGGTPSLVPPELLMAVLRRLPLAVGAEVTVECNPDNITAALLDSYLEGGVTRVSMGVQSFDPAVLAGLGRDHDPRSVQHAAGLLAARGFASWNADLIYGAAGESIESWRRTVESLLELCPPHISAYALTVEAGTPLASQPARHPDDDDQAAKYEIADELFQAAGTGWYEISNWAKPGHACRHNQLYWDQGDYVAYGVAAHGHRSGRRYWNVRSIERYIELIEAGRSPCSGEEVLDPEVRRAEAAQLLIRTRTGVPQAWLPEAVRAELPVGLVVRDGDQWVLTRHGRLLANEVAMRLVPPEESEPVRRPAAAT